MKTALYSEQPVATTWSLAIAKVIRDTLNLFQILLAAAQLYIENGTMQ